MEIDYARIEARILAYLMQNKETAMRLNLFAVRNLAGEIVLRGFDSKERAKEARDEMIANEGGRFFVTYDRDHRKYQAR